MDVVGNNLATTAGAARDFPDLARVLNVVEFVRRRWFWISFNRVVLLWVAFLMACTAVVCWVAGEAAVTGGTRWGLLGLWLAALGSGPVFLIYLLVFRQPSSLALAARAQREAGLPHNDLTNALQLAADPFWPSPLVGRIIAESSAAAETIDLARVFPLRELRRPAYVLTASAALSLVLIGLAYPTVKTGFSVLVRDTGHVRSSDSPSRDLPAAGADLHRLLQIQVTARFAPYLRRPAQVLAEKGEPLTIPEGTELEFILRSPRPIVRAEFKTLSNDVVALESDGVGRRYRGTWTPAADGGYAVVGEVDNLRLHWPTGAKPYWPVTVIKDRPPGVRLAEPGEDVELAPGGKVTLTIIAEDDYGLSELCVMAGSEVICRQSPGKAKMTASVPWTVPAGARIGDRIVYWAEVKDNRDLPGRGGQTAATKKFHIKIVSPEQYNRTEEAAAESLRERLREILKKQLHCRNVTIRARRADADLFETIDSEQRDIRDRLDGLARRKFPAALVEVGRALKRLGEGPAVRAAALAAELEATRDFDGLLACQQEIIMTLEALLAMLESGMDPVAGRPEAASRPADAPSLQKVADLLGKFIEQQRAALRQTRDLTGKTPEDFTAAEKAAFDQLRQLQEKWDRFLQQAVNDMDVLVKQDFAAAVTREELVEIQSQVQITKEAMEKQAVTIAVKAEEVGLELAEELTHNLERWLSNVPDRLKWEMEEPPEPIDVPLAQLPEELEDIVGELVEQEEDLYDAIEDQTSSWSDSLDKGAGWDVMDGPISNYSAKGITGNLLANNTEIGGRSGEGRTGRTSGEFVEQTAKGKGGRRTPTRLTQDAFQAGRIDDQSKEPAGGATGGGKLAGAGAEGLTGPRPKQMLPNLPALKEKQALLLARTQMAQLQARRNNWGNFNLDKVVRLMAANQADLDRGAYRSVLARKNVIIGSLKSSKTLIASKFQLDRPEQRLPQKLQAQMQTIDPHAIPESLRPTLNKYYELLARPETVGAANGEGHVE